MPSNRYYVDTILTENEIIPILGDEGHHLIRVLRAKKGDLIEIINGRGQLAQAKVLELQSQEATVLIQPNIQSHAPPPPLILAQAIPRMNHLEWIIEKATELNATQFWLFPGVLSEKETLSPNQLQRLKALSISAMKQCGRLDLPEIILMPPLAKWPQIDGTLLFGDTDLNAPYLWKIPLSIPTTNSVVFFVGPEKGFHPSERTFLLNTLKAKGVRLHQNILRAETAPLVALSLLQRYL